MELYLISTIYFFQCILERVLKLSTWVGNLSTFYPKGQKRCKYTTDVLSTSASIVAAVCFY